jgi:hypothetical protein
MTRLFMMTDPRLAYARPINDKDASLEQAGSGWDSPAASPINLQQEWEDFSNAARLRDLSLPPLVPRFTELDEEDQPMDAESIIAKGALAFPVLHFVDSKSMTDSNNLGGDQLEAEDVPLPVTVPNFRPPSPDNPSITRAPSACKSPSSMDVELEKLLAEINDFLQLGLNPSPPAQQGLDSVASFHRPARDYDGNYLSALSYSQIKHHYDYHLDHLVKRQTNDRLISDEDLIHLAHLKHAVAIWPQLPKSWEHPDRRCPLHQENILRAAQEEVDIEVKRWSSAYAPPQAGSSTSSSSGSTETLASEPSLIPTQHFDFSQMKSTSPSALHFLYAQAQLTERPPGVIDGHLRKKQKVDFGF